MRDGGEKRSEVIESGREEKFSIFELSETVGARRGILPYELSGFVFSKWGGELTRHPGYSGRLEPEHLCNRSRNSSLVEGEVDFDRAQF